MKTRLVLYSPYGCMKKYVTMQNVARTEDGAENSGDWCVGCINGSVSCLCMPPVHGCMLLSSRRHAQQIFRSRCQEDLRPARKILERKRMAMCRLIAEGPERLSDCTGDDVQEVASGEAAHAAGALVLGRVKATNGHCDAEYQHHAQLEEVVRAKTVVLLCLRQSHRKALVWACDTHTWTTMAIVQLQDLILFNRSYGCDLGENPVQTSADDHTKLRRGGQETSQRPIIAS